jgi:threonylcarbamoyladenosine tRNA methylthiotransferase MtaB
VVGPHQPADVYVLDTCTVTQVADRKARHALRAARRRNPAALIVATGCYAQRAPADLETLPEVDLVMGNTDKDVLVQEIVSLQRDVISPCAVGEERIVENGWNGEAGLYRARAMVKIQEGCNQVCAYCIVPKVRGRERSIPPDDLVAQVLALEEEGFQEVVLTGTQLVSYGFDIPEASLLRLLELLLDKTTIPRIRVSSLQPQALGEDMLGLWQDSRLCPHFHMPLQSGSDSMLRRMGRRYTVDLFVRTAERVRDLVPGASITTDVLTGFPGETEEEFQKTYRICRKVRFADMHVFPYSVRPGTSAAHFKGMIDPVTKGHRARLLLKLASEKATEFREGLVGQVRPVLWEGTGTGDHRGHWSGLTDNYVRVFTEDSRPLGNTITRTRLLEERDGSLYGRAGLALPPR